MSLRADYFASITEIPERDWDACAGAANPFVSHAFLALMERSGSADTRSGWAPRHIAIRDENGGLMAAAPLYLKNHSYGEYVFDWRWAEVYQQAGGRYYPKLQCAVPFSPVTGPRLLIRSGVDREAATGALIEGMLALAQETRVSSLHVAFPLEAERDALAARGFLPRIGEQYHWLNRGYRDFEDFLASLASRKRKAIRKERETARSHGFDIRILSGADIQDRHWDALYRFYRNTVGRKWGQAYLTPAFFFGLGETMAERCVMIVAERRGEILAAAFNLRGDETLYGRHWGAAGDFPCLHFELCYYQAIDYAIAHGLARVEAGAQGEHKIQRGYLPTPTHSAHWIADPAFRAAVARYLDQERELIAAGIAATPGPYRREECR